MCPPCGRRACPTTWCPSTTWRPWGQPAQAAPALGLAPAEIGLENHVPALWSAGVPYHFVPVHNMAVLAKAGPSRAGWAQAFGRGAALLHTREAQGHDHSFRARMFAPEIGISEDPATGSAVAALAGAI